MFRIARESGVTDSVVALRGKAIGGTVTVVLAAISACHFINDTLQALLAAIYPMLKSALALNFSQIGLITLTYQMVASILQPLVGLVADRRPRPQALTFGMGSTLCGLLLLASAHSFLPVLAAATLIGFGSAVFHPESSRVARLAAGGRPGFAQSVFQVGGNAGQAVGPVLAAFVVLPHGQGSIAWCAGLALIGMLMLWQIGQWAKAQGASGARKQVVREAAPLPRGRVTRALAVLVGLLFAKYFYLAGFTSYYTFYLISRFHVSVQTAQLDLFVFMGAVAAGTVLGGPIGDRIGRKRVIWYSIVGVLPFTLVLPHVGLVWTCMLSVPIGLILASAFPAIVVYAQELVPGNVGSISGLFFGVAFGMGGIGAAALGVIADHTSIEFVYRICAYLPALGLMAVFLPDIEKARAV
jgi:FSR family fosmidomycin resistance protein-like MFS transporter